MNGDTERNLGLAKLFAFGLGLEIVGIATASTIAKRLAGFRGSIVIESRMSSATVTDDFW